MMLRSLTIGCFAVGALVITSGLHLSADDSAPGPAIQSAADPAFDRYADVGLLNQAISEFNASLAADVTLQLAEGERILGRTHHALTAEDAFALALRLASETRDSGTIDRLTKNGRKEWQDKLSAAKLLTGTSRAAPESTVDITKLTPEGNNLLQAVLQGLRLAKLSANPDTINEMEKIVKESELVDDATRKKILAIVEAQRKDLPKEAAPELAAILDLGAGSRDSTYVPPAGTLAISVEGGGTVVSVAQANALVQNLTGAPVYAPTTTGGVLAIAVNNNIPVRTTATSVRVTAYRTQVIRIPRPFGGSSVVSTIKVPVKIVSFNCGGFSLTASKIQVKLK